VTQLLPELSPAGLELWLVPREAGPAQPTPSFSERTKPWIESCCAQLPVGFQAVWSRTKECAVPSWGCRPLSPEVFIILFLGR